MEFLNRTSIMCDIVVILFESGSLGSNYVAQYLVASGLYMTSFDLDGYFLTQQCENLLGAVHVPTTLAFDVDDLRISESTEQRKTTKTSTIFQMNLAFHLQQDRLSHVLRSPASCRLTEFRTREEMFPPRP